MVKKQTYKNQVALLLSVIPEIAKEKCFALHGGTAINLFVRNMPRLSVDIDLIYIPIEDRATSLKNISEALERIKSSIKKAIPSAVINHLEEISKLQISANNAQVKLEVNQTNRGALKPPMIAELCEYAQESFDAFCTIQTIDRGQLYGGKICAALDRQHPRDMFDVKYLLNNEGFNEEIKRGFMLCLLSSGRPISELISPNRLNQKIAMESKFDGMSSEPFTYENFEYVREQLIEIIQKNITGNDREFLIGFVNGKPDWNIYDFQRFPSVQWKLQNLQSLKDNNPAKHKELLLALKEKLKQLKL